MKIMKFSLLAGAMVAATGVASAQPEGPAPARAAELTRDQAVARADQRFQRIDSNRDGRVTSDELRQAGEARRAERGERRAERRGQAFDRIDANRDDQISREEFSARQANRAERRGRDGRRGMRGRGGPGGERFAMRMLGQDGVLTAEEFRARAAQRFDRLDANRDGRITADERRGSRGRFRGGPGAPPPPAQD